MTKGVTRFSHTGLDACGNTNHREAETQRKPGECMDICYEGELTGAVIGAAIEVHRVLGPGLLESIYQRSMEIEFKIRGISVSAQTRVPLIYKGYDLGDDLVMDFFFPDKLVVELKAVTAIVPVHIAQTISYMKLSQVKLGLLINFNVPVLKEGIKRIVL